MDIKEIKVFGDLVGSALAKIDVINEDNLCGDRIIFTLDNGEQYQLFHYQDCCESVNIEDICGDMGDLLGSPILLAEEVSNDNEHPEELPADDERRAYYNDSFTWTFYKLSTV